MGEKTKFDHSQVLTKCQRILLGAGLEDIDVGISSFLDYSDKVRDVVQAWPREKVEKATWLIPFVQALRELRDDFESLVKKDPLILYKPAHDVALDFHKSQAKVRYFYSGNRASKTQSAVADNRWVLTNSHPYRVTPPMPTSVLVIGTDYSTYGKDVFVKKYIEGEGGNILSPVFPDGGKWFYSYNSVTKQLKIACPECAEKGKAGSCPHPKSTLSLASDRGSAQAIAGGQHGQIQFDEQIQKKFFQEAIERLKTVINSSMIVTETPLLGKAFWTYEILYKLGEKKTKFPGTKQVYVSLHNINQYDAGLVPKEEIEASEMTMSDNEVRARIYGEHVAFGEQLVFNLDRINEMREKVKKPVQGNLLLSGDRGGRKLRDVLADLDPYESEKKLRFAKDFVDGPFYIWERPKKIHQYVIGADVAQGLTNADFSAASVWKMVPNGNIIDLVNVAKFKDWVNPVPYAAQLYKLAMWYNCGWIIPERNGPGMSMIYELTQELHCPFVFQNISNIAMVDQSMDRLYGLDTTSHSKPILVAEGQKVIFDRMTGHSQMVTPDKELLGELENYGQEVTGKGSVTFAAQGSGHDDEVMAFLLAAFVVRTSPWIYDWDKHKEVRKTHVSDGLGEDARRLKEQMQNILDEIERSEEKEVLDYEYL